MAAIPRRTVTVIAPEELGGADAASPAPELEVELEADRRATGAISFAGATLARLRGRRPRGDGAAPDDAAASGRARHPARPSAAAGGARRPQTAPGDRAAPSPLDRAPAPSRPADAVTTAPIVLAEENKIRQVVTNLIGNAIRFTSDDSPDRDPRRRSTTPRSGR